MKNRDKEELQAIQEIIGMISSEINGLQDVLDKECEHHVNTKVVKRFINNHLHFVRQCEDCYHQAGNAISKKEAEKLTNGNLSSLGIFSPVVPYAREKIPDLVRDKKDMERLLHEKEGEYYKDCDKHEEDKENALCSMIKTCVGELGEDKVASILRQELDKIEDAKLQRIQSFNDVFQNE